MRAFKAVGGAPLFMPRGDAARYLEDVDGNSYIDYVMSWGPLIHGHAPKGLRKALAAAAARGTSFGAPTELETRLAQRVATLMPSMERIRFVSSGTEATMSALRVARAATGPRSHRQVRGLLSRPRRRVPRPGGIGRDDARRADQPRRAGGGGARHAARALQRPRVGRAPVRRRHRKQIAAVFVEPIAGNMGVVPPQPGFLEGLRALCDREHALLVFDEVISGFRAAAGGAQQLTGVRPDLTCLGKIIGGGLPVGAYGGRADLMDLVAPAGPVYQAGTLSGNPLAMTAGLWSLRSSRRSSIATWRSSARSSRRASPTPRATPACRCRSTRSARC